MSALDDILASPSYRARSGGGPGIMEAANRGAETAREAWDRIAEFHAEIDHEMPEI